MIRQAKVKEMPDVVEDFRMRGREVSRIEAFTDCVLGLAITLLVVQTEVPSRWEDLVTAMQALIVFAFTFSAVFAVWSRHYTFCRRYGLQDSTTRNLTGILLFVVLAYIYPLKYLMTLFATFILKIDVGFHLSDAELQKIRISQLFIFYGLGFAAVQLLFALLYLHAYRQREELDLDEIARLDTLSWMREQFGYLLIPLISVVLALVLPMNLIGYAGYIYFLLGFVGWFHGANHGKKHQALVARLAQKA